MKTIFIFLLFICGVASAQTTTFFKTYGNGRGRCVEQMTDSNYIVVGITHNFTSWGDIYLLKINQYGNIIWNKHYGDTSPDDVFGVHQTKDGGFIVAGFKGIPDTLIDGIDTSFDFKVVPWIIKTNGNGDTIWTRIWNERSDYISIKQLSDTNYIVAGTLNPDSSGNNRASLIKLDTNGEIIWSNSYENNGFVFDVIETVENGLLFVGNKNGLIITKTDSAGTILWEKNYVNLSWGEQLIITNDNNFAIAGGANDFFYGKFNINNGDTIWTKYLGGNNLDFSNSLDQCEDGGYILTGITKSFGLGESSIWLVRTNENGDTLWTRTYGNTTGFDKGFSVHQTFDNGFIVTGYISIGITQEMVLIKADSLGNAPALLVNEIADANLFFSAFPNPASNSSTINVLLPHSQEISLELYDAQGKLVKLITNGKVSKGTHQYNVSLTNISEGVYFYRLVTEKAIYSKKLVVIK